MEVLITMFMLTIEFSTDQGYRVFECHVWKKHLHLEYLTTVDNKRYCYTEVTTGTAAREYINWLKSLPEDLQQISLHTTHDPNALLLVENLSGETYLRYWSVPNTYPAVADLEQMAMTNYAVFEMYEKNYFKTCLELCKSHTVYIHKRRVVGITRTIKDLLLFAPLYNPELCKVFLEGGLMYRTHLAAYNLNQKRDQYMKENFKPLMLNSANEISH